MRTVKITQAECALLLLAVFPFFFGTLIDLLKLPWAIRYFMDVSWAFLLLLMWIRRYRQNQKGYSVLLLWTTLFFLYAGLTYLVQYQSLMYYLWGVRNNFRFFVAFFAFAVFLKSEDIHGYFRLFGFLLWINVVATLYQYFGLGIAGDHLGGIFGTEKGANGYTNIFFVIMVTRDILLYLEKKENLSNCILKCVAMFIVAALAELKFFFVEYILILVLVVLFTNFTWRKLCVILSGILLIVVGAAILVTAFPQSEGFLSWDFLLNYALTDKGYTSSGDLNRLNAISKINELWLKTSWQRLFGLGLGNCDTASFDFLNTPFYEAYGTMHYTWISYAMMYLECGWIGLIFYFGFFVLVYLSIRRIEKRCSGVATTYCRMGRILALMCMIIAIYNSSLRTEAGYMMYFALSVPFVMRRDQIGAARRGEKK